VSSQSTSPARRWDSARLAQAAVRVDALPRVTRPGPDVELVIANAGSEAIESEIHAWIKGD
jgi:hypothetical protein